MRPISKLCSLTTTVKMQSPECINWLRRRSKVPIRLSIFSRSDGANKEEGSCSALAETTIEPWSKTKVSFTNISKDERQADHVIFKVALNDGQDYAIDLTGAQYGRYQTVLPWSEYRSDMVKNVVRVDPLGATATRLRRDERIDWYLRRQQNVSFKVAMAVNLWSHVVGQSIANTFKDDTGPFAQKSSTLQQYLREAVEWFTQDRNRFLMESDLL